VPPGGVVAAGQIAYKVQGLEGVLRYEFYAWPYQLAIL
jgi:hypothetical protein